MVSAFLDNVTTMLLMIPVTIEIAVTLKINPLVLLIPEVFASNVGGTATLIGDPPNILIGSYAGLTFGQFVTNLALVCTVCLIVTSFFYLWWHKKDYLKAEVKDIPRTIAYLKEEYQITNKKLMIQSLMLLGFTILLFALHGFLHMPVSIAALIGSLVLLAISGEDIVEMLEHEVEWPTLVFFIGLFMVIAGAEETGLIQMIANWVKDLSGGNLTTAIILVLWVSAIASAFIDNIPFTATMLPIIAFLNQTIPGAESGVLWWSLALGALGGERHHDRGQRQRGHRGPGGEGRLPHLLYYLHEGLLVAYDDHRYHCHGLSLDRLLKPSLRGERHHDGASCQRGHRGDDGKSGLPYLLPGLPEGLLVAHDDHRHYRHGLPLDSLLKPG